MAQKTQSEKSKLKRARSWQKNQAAKVVRIAENEAAHARNLELGSTGKQRANQAHKAEREE